MYFMSSGRMVCLISYPHLNCFLQRHLRITPTLATGSCIRMKWKLLNTTVHLSAASVQGTSLEEMLPHSRGTLQKRHNSFIPGGGGDMAAAAAAACATLNHQQQQQTNTSDGVDSEPHYEASYTSFKTDEMLLEDDVGTDLEISKLGFDSIDRAGCGGGGCGGGGGADIASDGDFEDAFVDHIAVVTVRHRETIRHDPHSVLSVVVFLKLKDRLVGIRSLMESTAYSRL